MAVELNYFVLLISLVFSIIAILLGALAWGLLLSTIGESPSWMERINIHLSSNLAKYIPGYAWQLIGKAYMTRQVGIPLSNIGYAMTLELLLLVLTGLGLALIFFPSNKQLFGDMYFLTRDRFTLIHFIGFFGLVTLPFISILILKRIYQIRSNGLLSIRSFFGAYSAILIGWLVFGVSYWLIGMTIAPLSLTELPVFIFSLTVSIIIGLAIVIVPGSIGVRESIMVYLLTNLAVPSTIAVIIAILSRLIITLSELTSYYFFKQIFYNRQTNKNERENSSK